jgi:hypothetical protein
MGVFVKRFSLDIAVVEGIIKLVDDVGVEFAAKGDINDLVAAADAQEGHATLAYLLDQLNLDLVPFRVDIVDLFMVNAPETDSLDISSAGEHDPVQARKEFIKGIEGKVGGDEGGQCAGPDQSE